MPLAEESYEDLLNRLGYVHRDLKPANILRVDSRWALADFGLILPTVRESSILTSRHSAYGSHFYAAPEQANDFRNVPEQTDIFALGCMLHDSVERLPTRVPFAQIQATGPYAEVIAKCTETDPRARYQTVAALRAAIFEVFDKHRTDVDFGDEADHLVAVLDNPHSAERWKALIRQLEELDSFPRHLKLQSINSELLRSLKQSDDVLFARMMALICEWARSTGFDWAYCDVVGDRLLDAYRIGPVRIRCEIVLAALELAVSHNRWHVMNQVGAMLGQTAESGLIDRILIEIDLKPSIASRITTIEEVIYWPRENWHPTLSEYLTSKEF
jgi:eukaryotic-like serine/threonine-protein kinase